MLVAQSCSNLCDPMDCIVHGTLQARIPEWIVIFVQGIVPTQGSNLGLPHCRQIVYHLSHHQGKKKWSEVAQSCPTLCDPMDCSLPGSSVHGIFQARVLEWVAISFSKRSSQPRDGTRVSRIAGRRFTIWATREKVSTSLTDSTPKLWN